ncbi:hypothetical protein CAEBREN_21031 [Caenorhabditis brenneri]|uniref:JmjC domain-containing protein n=1 Tax=Caenorhabditis brenneri TaxID=135651 RepID=G0MLU4_CAEBE|nr:hypothetical protein CAEBREN_21031 [Caenorhabditis brenneri]
MPPKRKPGPKKSATPARKKTRRGSSSELDQLPSDGEEAVGGFDKADLQRCSKYDLESLMRDPAFQHPEFVHTMNPEDLTVEWYEKNAFDNPIHFRCDPTRIGMTVPPSTFTVNDILDLVGGNRMIEVVKVKDQGSVKMSLQEFVDFYNTPEADRTTLYNVLSLEYSLTPLEDRVKSPEVVRKIDWVGNKWPDALRQRWISFNGRDKKLYNPHHTFPKVQNYCLMSVAQCYTDFHIDFSGTSVWYHVLKGRKVFWLIPPTETNFMIYQEFIKTVGDNAFFGSSVEKCHVAILEPGDTMLIPSGWIHAVYTPVDSLVFGGNFLHSMSIKMQLRVYAVENKLNITRKFRLPYNEELLFYVIADYVKQWTGREYVRPLRIEDAKMDYCGEKWKAAGGHLKKIVYSDYESGVEVTDDMVKTEEGVSTKDEVKVIAMHAENSMYDDDLPYTYRSAYTIATGLEEEAEDEEEVKVERKPTKEELDARWEAEIDELASTNSLIFYKNPKHDFVRNKCVPDHKLPIGHEPPIYFKDDVISRIEPRLLEELEALGAYFRRKGRVEVAEGICQPASLLNAFNQVLRKRRAELEGKPFEFTQIMPRRYTRSTKDTYDYEPAAVEPTTTAASPSEPVGRRQPLYKVEDFPDEFLEMEADEHLPRPKLPEQPSSGPLEYIPTPVIREDANGFEMEAEEEYDPAEGMEQQEPKEETPEPEEQEEPEEEYEAPVTRRSSSRKSAAAAKAALKKEASKEVEEEEPEEPEEISKEEEIPKKAAPSKKEKKEKTPDPEKEARSEEKKRERKLEKERKRKEKERREQDSILDAELRAAHGAGSLKSKKKKPEKPAYVGGLPTAPIQNDPVVSNPYNYDPRMEMMKLGTGQLKSAYRKTRNNVELHIEKNLYKLEPKRGSQEGSGESREQSTEPEQSPAAEPHDRYNNYQPQESHYDDYDGQKPPAKRPKYEPISVDTYDTPSSSKHKSSRVAPSPYTPTAPSPASSSTTSSYKPKLVSPSVSNDSMTPHHYKSSDSRRSSDSTPATSAMRKGVYMPALSRQDKMIAEGSPGGSRPVSERRPSFIPDFGGSSRHSSMDGGQLYTPTMPSAVKKPSWIPNTSNTTRHSLDGDSPIDVVNESPDSSMLHSPHFHGRAITPPPITLQELQKDKMMNGNKRSHHHSSSHHHGHGHHHDHHRGEDGKNPRIPSKEAVSQLKNLVGKLKAINDA